MLKIPVRCAHAKLENPKKLEPNPRNPNKHPPDQIEIIKKLLQKHGWRFPITVSNQSGLVVRGEGRLKAALESGLKKVPVDYQDYDDPEQEMSEEEICRRLGMESEEVIRLYDRGGMTKRGRKQEFSRGWIPR